MENDLGSEFAKSAVAIISGKVSNIESAIREGGIEHADEIARKEFLEIPLITLAGAINFTIVQANERAGNGELEAMQQIMDVGTLLTRILKERLGQDE